MAKYQIFDTPDGTYDVLAENRQIGVERLIAVRLKRYVAVHGATMTGADFDAVKARIMADIEAGTHRQFCN